MPGHCGSLLAGKKYGSGLILQENAICKMISQDMAQEIGDYGRWLSQSSVGPLKTNEVHVWLASVEIRTRQYQTLWNVLSEEEMERSRRYRFEKDRTSFVASRGILKTLVAGYLKMTPERVSFVYGPYGKPDLAAEVSPVPLRFNASHSRGLALFAFALDREIGVDIEYVRPDIDAEHIARRFFSARERDALDKLPQGIKEKCFFTCWARKEAFLKAVGKGLSFGLDRIEVSINPGSPASLLGIEDDEEDAVLWSLHDLPASKDYAAALAVKGRGMDLCLRRWNGSGSQ
jgi:4'-phosphopantetheinyl transferase